jgi:hypothetical protein
MRSEEYTMLVHHILCSIRDLGPSMAAAVEVTKTLEIVFSKDKMIYYLCMLAASILSMLYGTNLFICLHLLQILVCSTTLRSLVSALMQRGKAFLMIYLLILILMLVFAVVAFFYFAESFFIKVGGGLSAENSCSTTLNCLLTIIDEGIRSKGGIGDVLLQPSARDMNLFIERYFFDTLFFLIVNFIGISLIIGTIVDSLAELRIQRERIHASKNSRCFMCDLERGWFDRKFNGFHNHIKRHHRIGDYLAFIYGLKTKHPNMYSGIEKAVMEQLLRHDISWLPNNRALILEKDGVFTEKSQQAEELINKLTELHETLEDF